MKKDTCELIVWQKAVTLCKHVYAATRVMPDSERFGLTLQMRRAVVSIASNIAEGNARQTLPDYIRFLVVARGSLAELETQMIIARELDLLSSTQTEMALIEEVGRILQALIDSLRRKQRGSS